MVYLSSTLRFPREIRCSACLFRNLTFPWSRHDSTCCFTGIKLLSQTINVCFPPSGLQSAIVGVLRANRRLNRRTKNVSDLGRLRGMIYLLTATGVETENCAAAHLIQRLSSHPQVCDWTFIFYCKKEFLEGNLHPHALLKPLTICLRNSFYSTKNE